MSDWLFDLESVRRVYAHQMLGISGVRNDRLERVFAMIRREDFLGAEPWKIVWPSPTGSPLPVNDPVYIYQDVVLALAPERGVNNGSPALHAKMLNDLAVQPGQHVAHVGAGVGYYTAMLAELAVPSGKVTAIEFDARLAERARTNLAAWSNVTVICGDAGTALVEDVDRIYVNFAVAGPAASWIERLRPGGKLLLPLGAPHPDDRAKFPRHSARGAAFLIERMPNGLAARRLYPAYFVCAEGTLAGDAAAELALYQAFEKATFEAVRSLRWNAPVDQTNSWYSTPDWSLSFAALDGEQGQKS